jgi:GntR family transcriptional regulator
MVDFKQDRAIYLQMAERICDEILAGKYHSDDRIPSVREQAVMFEVNTNTVVKTYDLLLQWGIIYTRRGLGYFVTAFCHGYEKSLQTGSKLQPSYTQH